MFFDLDKCTTRITSSMAVFFKIFHTFLKNLPYLISRVCIFFSMTVLYSTIDKPTQKCWNLPTSRGQDSMSRNLKGKPLF